LFGSGSHATRQESLPSTWLGSPALRWTGFTGFLPLFLIPGALAALVPVMDGSGMTDPAGLGRQVFFGRTPRKSPEVPAGLYQPP
jgi:hypothetical protein